MVYVYIYICVSYVHNPGVPGRFIDSTKKGNGRLGKPAIDTLDSSMMEKMAADSKAIDTLDSSMMEKMAADLKAKGRKPGSTRGLLASTHSLSLSGLFLVYEAFTHSL